MAITTWMSLFGFMLFLPFGIYKARFFDFSAAGFADWMAILYYGVVVTVIAFLLWFGGLYRHDPGQRLTAVLCAVGGGFLLDASAWLPLRARRNWLHYEAAAVSRPGVERAVESIVRTTWIGVRRDSVRAPEKIIV